MTQILFNSKCDIEFRFLSNFWPCSIQFDGIVWLSSEHLYQALKAKYAHSDKLYESIKNASTAAETKVLGKKVKLDETAQKTWELCKEVVMIDVVRLKFNQNTGLKEALLATNGFELVEFAPWCDRFWGVDKNMIGENRMGKILMKVREELK